MTDNTEFDSFLNNLEEDGSLFDPSQIISISTSAGGRWDIPATEPLTVGQVFDAAQVTTGSAVDIYVNGTVVDRNFVVAPGATIAVVGTVKGG
jgi:hypothetical protein